MLFDLVMLYYLMLDANYFDLYFKNMQQQILDLDICSMMGKI